ncbi:Inosine-uridine preferring nucleoside hydrolase [Stenotrophomonas maltophilia EPM1]|nr:Inosine-uridine preferring nucleoside hydrolase [Stenotrophomonas maltophilia EPM1]
MGKQVSSVIKSAATPSCSAASAHPTVVGGFGRACSPAPAQCNSNGNVKSGSGFLLAGRGGVGRQDT